MYIFSQKEYSTQDTCTKTLVQDLRDGLLSTLPFTRFHWDCAAGIQLELIDLRSDDVLNEKSSQQKTWWSSTACRPYRNYSVREISV